MKKKSAITLAVLLPLQVLAIRWLAGHPAFVEKWYSLGFYPWSSRFMRWPLGFLPFSIGDLLYALLIIFLILWFIRRIKTGFKKPQYWLIDALAALSVIYACFHIFWGFNYYRLPLHQSLGIENDYTTGQLVKLSETLIQKSNSLQLEITQNDSAKVVVPYTKNELFSKTIEGYKSIIQKFPELDYNSPSLKRSLFSLPLTYMGFNGYLNPITNEAQVNTLIVPYKLPTTASHEIGHQLGFAKENEANFIACLVTMNHPDIYFRYCGYTFALRYCLGELYKRDPEKMKMLTKTIHPGILKNYQDVQDFWNEHQNPLEPLFKDTYNRYLIANNQAGGMESYNYVVALLVNYFDSVENEF